MNHTGPETLGSPNSAQVPLPNPAALLLAIAFIAGYVCLDWVSYIHPMQEYGITPWNPQPALAIALLMLGGQRWLPVVFLAAVAAEWVVRGTPESWAAAGLVAAVLSLGYAAVARALSGRLAIGPGLETRGDAIRLVAVVAAGALLTGILYIAALLAGGQGPLDDPFAALMRYWIGDAVGILVTLPVVLMLSTASRRREMVATLARGETLLHAAAVASALAVVFNAPAADQVRFFYVLFLPLVFTATRYGLAGSAVAALVIQGAVIVNGEIVGLRDITVIEFQALLIALTVTGIFLGVTVDERRRAEEDLRRTMRMAAAGEMAAALAHELNQPLTAVASYARSAELIVGGQGDPGLLTQTLGKLVAESTRAADVVRRLRDFFRTGATRLAPVALADIVSRVLSAQKAAAELRGVTLRAELPAQLPSVLADDVQLEVVVKNLVTNAIEAAAQGAGARIVRITAAPDGARRVQLSIQDNGPGVAPAEAERIFEPFETSRATGMGMGLAISRAIVEAHGGRLWVEPGPGGVFRMQLPTVDFPDD